SRLPLVLDLLGAVLLFLPLPEDYRAAALALLDRAAALQRLLEREEVRRCKAMSAEQEDVDAAVWLVRDEIARPCGDGAPRLAPGHGALLQLVENSGGDDFIYVHALPPGCVPSGTSSRKPMAAAGGPRRA